MNQKEIGKFISKYRKEKKLTQQELADKLGVTDRAVSHWENGRRLPDYSILKPLSEELGVSVNEILTGEKINEKDVLVKADENILKLADSITLKSMKSGIIGMCICFIILNLISAYKDVSTSPLVSMICAYNAVTTLSRYKYDKSVENLIAGILFSFATILNTIMFIVN